MLWSDGALEIVINDPLLAELERALDYPKLRKRIAPEDAAMFVELLRIDAERGTALAEPPLRSTDPGDDYLVALAAGSGARADLRRRAPAVPTGRWLAHLHARAGSHHARGVR